MSRIPNADVDDVDDLNLEPEVSPKTPGKEADESTALARVRKLKETLEGVMQMFLKEYKEQ